MSYHRIVLFFFVSINFSYSQTQRELSVSLFIDKDTFEVFDTWRCQINLTNIGQDSVKIYPLFITQNNVNNFGFVDLEFRTDNDSTWRSTSQILNSHFEFGFYLNTPDLRISLAPSQSISSIFYLPPRLTPISDSVIKIRASYLFHTFGHVIYTSDRTIYLKKYGRLDSSAYNYLKTLPRPDFILHPLHPVQYSTSDIEHAEYIVKEFPSSTFALYGKLFLAQLYLGIATSTTKNEKELTQAINYLRRSKFYSYDVLDSHQTEFVNKAEEILGIMRGVLFQIYESDPPSNLVQEFSYPPKN